MSQAMSEQWSCSACTFLNDANLHRCLACDSVNEGSGWSCPQCTAWTEQAPSPPRGRCNVCGYKPTDNIDQAQVIQVDDDDDNDSGFGDDNNNNDDDDEWGDAVEDDGIDEDEQPIVKAQPVTNHIRTTQTAIADKPAEKAATTTTVTSAGNAQISRLYEQFEKISILYRDHVQNADDHKDESNNGTSGQRKRQKAVDEEPLAKHKAMIHLSIQMLYDALPPQSALQAATTKGKPKSLSKTQSNSASAPKQCSVCYSTFSVGKPKTSRTSSAEECWPVLMLNCAHSSVCQTCFTQHLHHRITDGRVLPWISCPHEECVAYVDPINITGGSQLSSLDLVLFIHTVMAKTLRQSPYFIECQTSKCLYGFISFNPKISEKKLCLICNKNQIVSFTYQTEQLDTEFKQMIEKGILRDCPQCHFYTLKEKGVCNVINCNKCGIWWNWRSRDIGTSERLLKEQARRHHTLWENGELQYQMSLEQTNPQEFKKLLERNGVKYDPNYIRGSGR